MNWTRSGAIDTQQLRRKYKFASLVRPQTGVMEHVTYLPQELGSPSFEVASTALGNLTMAFPHIKDRDGDVRNKPLGGAGADVDPEMAWVRAVVEGAERYASMVYSPEDWTVATASELGADALDLDRIPRCAASEYAHPRCPLRPASKRQRIRWARGRSLITGKDVFVPAIMTHLYVQPWPAECFWLPISTGVAAHTSLPAALTSAICESIERDAIALTWLARLPLPRIELADPPPPQIRPLCERLNRSSVRQLFFDATTDTGVPTVFSLQLCAGHPSCSMFVSCATALDPTTACGKAIREAAPARSVMSKDRPVPADIRDFCDLTNGADYYGRGGHDSDFDFLLRCSKGTTELGPAVCESEDEGQSVRFLVARLRALGMEAIAVDLTTDELRDAGLWVVRVVVPDLVPISFVHRARYLGTPRIYDYAKRFGIEALAPERVNPGPMPFA